MIKQLGHLLGIVFLSNMASFALMMLLFLVILPKSWYGYELAVPTWIGIALLTGIFSHWYFHLYPPRVQDVVIAILAWTILPFVVSVLYALLTLGDANYVVRSLDTYVQYALQVIVVGVMGYIARREYAVRLIGEGRSL